MMLSSAFHSSSPTPPVSRPLTPIEGNPLPETPSTLSLGKGENDQSIKNCPYEKHGCKFVGNLLAVQEHMRDQNDIHITLLGEVLQPLQNEINQGTQLVKATHEVAEELVNQAKRVMHAYSHSFLWRIEKYPKTFRAAKKLKKLLIESPPFLSHRFGYNMTAFFVPFGTLETTQKYASISISLMQGAHDVLLEWPFAYTIIFTMFDQTGKNEHHIEKLVPQISEDNLPSFDRPKKTPNEKFGLGEFICITEMQEGGKYVKDGTVFIAIDFETSNKKAICN